MTDADAFTEKSSFYDILGVDTKATKKEIKMGYRRKALAWHPDKNVNNAVVAEEQFKLVARAYATLSDVEKRQDYDRWGHTDGASGGRNPFGGGGRGWCRTGRLGICCFVGSGAFFVWIPATAVNILHAFPQQRHSFCFVHGETTRPGRVALRKHDNVVVVFLLLLLLLCSTGKHDHGMMGALLLLLLPGQRVTFLVPFTGLLLVQGMAVPSIVFRTGDLLRQLNHGTAHQTLLLHSCSRRRTGHQFFQLLFQLMKLCFGGLAIVFVVGVMGGQFPFVVNRDPGLVFGHAGQDVLRGVVGGRCQMVVVQLGVLGKCALGMCCHLSWKSASLVCLGQGQMGHVDGFFG